MFFFFYKGLPTLIPRSHFHFFSLFLFKLSSPYFLSVLTPTPTLKLKLLVYILMLVSLPLKKKNVSKASFKPAAPIVPSVSRQFFLGWQIPGGGEGVGRGLRQLAAQRPVLGWEWRKRVNAAPPPPPPRIVPCQPYSSFHSLHSRVVSLSNLNPIVWFRVGNHLHVKSRSKAPGWPSPSPSPSPGSCTRSTTVPTRSANAP